MDRTSVLYRPRTWTPSQAVYRRRRLAAGAVVVIVAGLMLAVVLALTAPLRAGAGGSGATASVVVQQGDTIWDLARQHAPSGQDQMSYVAEVVALNDVQPSTLRPGMVIQLPVDY